MSAESAHRTLVIGYGSPIRGDDALGPLAADRLEAEGVPGPVQIRSRHVLTAELAEDIAQADRVIFIDAAAEGPPGELRVRPLVPDAGSVSTMAHFLDPGELLAWAEALYDCRPQAWLVTVSGHAFDYGLYDLSPAVATALPALLTRVRALIAA